MKILKNNVLGQGGSVVALLYRTGGEVASSSHEGEMALPDSLKNLNKNALKVLLTNDDLVKPGKSGPSTKAIYDLMLSTVLVGKSASEKAKVFRGDKFTSTGTWYLKEFKKHLTSQTGIQFDSDGDFGNVSREKLKQALNLSPEQIARLESARQVAREVSHIEQQAAKAQIAKSSTAMSDRADKHLTKSETAGDFIKKFPKGYRTTFANEQGLTWYDASASANRKLKQVLKGDPALWQHFAAGYENFVRDRIDAAPTSLGKSRSYARSMRREMSGKGLSADKVSASVKRAVTGMDNISHNFELLTNWDALLQNQKSPLLKGGLLGVVTGAVNTLRGDTGFKAKLRALFGEGAEAKYDTLFNDFVTSARKMDASLNAKYGKNGMPWYKEVFAGQNVEDLNANKNFRGVMALARMNLLEVASGVLIGGAAGAVPAITNFRIGASKAVFAPDHDQVLRVMAGREYMQMQKDFEAAREADKTTSNRMVQLGSRAFRDPNSYKKTETIKSTVSEKEFNQLIGQLQALVDSATRLDKNASAYYKQTGHSANKALFRWFEVNDWGKRGANSARIKLASNTDRGRGERIAALKKVIQTMKRELESSRKVDMYGNKLPGYKEKTSLKSFSLPRSWKSFEKKVPLSVRESFGKRNGHIFTPYGQFAFEHKGKKHLTPSKSYTGDLLWTGKGYIEQNKVFYDALRSNPQLLQSFTTHYNRTMGVGKSPISSIAKAEANMVRKLMNATNQLEEAIEIKTRTVTKLDVAKMRSDKALGIVGVFTQFDDVNSLLNTFYAAPALRNKIRKYYTAFNKVGRKKGSTEALKAQVVSLSEDANAKQWFSMVLGMINGSGGAEAKYKAYCKRNMNSELKAGGGRDVRYANRTAFGEKITLTKGREAKDFRDKLPLANIKGQYVVQNHLNQIYKQTGWMPQPESYLQAIEGGDYISDKSVRGINLGRNNSPRSSFSNVSTPQGYYKLSTPMRIESFGQTKVVHITLGIKPECSNVILLEESVKILQEEGLCLDPTSAQLSFYLPSSKPWK